jgi:hypothetical protein
MRRFLSPVILLALTLPAFAADAPKDRPQHARQTWEQRFADANTAHDGHLSPDEAKAGYPQVAKHFDDIDVDHKGYVTANDVRAWRVMRKAAHRLTQPPEDKLRPRPAFQRRTPDVPQSKGPSHQTMAASSKAPA